MDPDYTDEVWRTGRRVGRTIYAQLLDQPGDNDPLIGVMDTTTLAAAAVHAHNEELTWTRGDQP
jgi:hypothetical protein